MCFLTLPTMTHWTATRQRLYDGTLLLLASLMIHSSIANPFHPHHRWCIEFKWLRTGMEGASPGELVSAAWSKWSSCLEALLKEQQAAEGGADQGPSGRALEGACTVLGPLLQTASGLPEPVWHAIARLSAVLLVLLTLTGPAQQPD